MVFGWVLTPRKCPEPSCHYSKYSTVVDPTRPNHIKGDDTVHDGIEYNNEQKYGQWKKNGYAFSDMDQNG